MTCANSSLRVLLVTSRAPLRRWRKRRRNDEAPEHKSTTGKMLLPHHPRLDTLPSRSLTDHSVEHRIGEETEILLFIARSEERREDQAADLQDRTTYDCYQLRDAAVKVAAGVGVELRQIYLHMRRSHHHNGALRRH